ncbi:MAG: hypothetical protein IPH05_03330 [Flavobacteriales bacterium]|nr:hypothetical protein [Flavobacteriales bacterium]
MANKKAGTPLPRNPVPNSGSQFFRNKPPWRNNTGESTSHAMAKRLVATWNAVSTGTPSWKRPRFIRMKELPK